MMVLDHAKVRRLREERGLSCASLAGQVGVREETARRWEDGRSQPLFALGVRLAEVLEVEPWELLTGSEAA